MDDDVIVFVFDAQDLFLFWLRSEEESRRVGVLFLLHFMIVGRRGDMRVRAERERESVCPYAQ